MDGHRNYPEEPDSRWYPEEHGYGEPRFGDPAYGAGNQRPASGFRVPEPRPTSSESTSTGYTAGYQGAGYGDGPLSTDPRNDPLTGDLPDAAPSRYHAEPIDLGQLRRGPAEAGSGAGVTGPTGGAAVLPNVATQPINPLGQPAAATQPINPLGQPAGATQPINPLGQPAAATQPINPLGQPAAATHETTSLNVRIPSTPTAHPGAPAVGLTDAERGALYRTKRTGLAIAVTAVTVLVEIPVLRAFADAAFESKVLVSGLVSSLMLLLGLPMFALGFYAALGGAAAAPGQGVRAWLRTPLAYLPISLVLLLAAAIAS